MNADPLTYAPFLLLLLLGALVEIRYWIRNRARMTPKARLRRGLFLAAVAGALRSALAGLGAGGFLAGGAFRASVCPDRSPGIGPEGQSGRPADVHRAALGNGTERDARRSAGPAP